MSNPLSQVTVLCEDQRTYHFARRYLQECGLNSRNIHPKICTSAKESAFNFVIREYENVV
jgi:hypothetical protein